MIILKYEPNLFHLIIKNKTEVQVHGNVHGMNNQKIWCFGVGEYADG